MSEIVLHTDLPFAQRLSRGKVRDIYRLGDDLLLVTTDRISAFDVVMGQGIPNKGCVLTALSKFWFQKLAHIIPNHFLSDDVDAWHDVPPAHRATLAGRSMRCRLAKPLPVEWVVRGYLTGSGFNDYKKSGAVSGVALPPGLEHASKIDPPILTPSTKAETGHDLPISFETVCETVGADVAGRARDAALRLYTTARDYAAERGIVIADTKFEFGLVGDELILIDECLTPDSSRFWPAEEVAPGKKPTSFDKQRLRDYLATLAWNKEPPPPPLPADVIADTAKTYHDIYQRLIAP
ncbi:MAG: phosphoribosylaminoimidazolesuccinocarboxamide synthase [Planctomycetota bacterium]